MNKRIAPTAVLLVVLALVGGSMPALARIAPDTIEYKEWPDGLKPNVVVVRAPRRLCKTFDAGDRRQFRWQLPKRADAPSKLHEGMTKVGVTLLAKNNYQTDPHATGLVIPEIYTVVEIGIISSANPEVVRRIKENVILPTMVGTGIFRIQMEDLEAIPPDWKKLGLFQMVHNQMSVGVPMLVAAYDDISDDDLREIAFEEGVTRTYCWRE